MATSESGLRNQQQMILIKAARKALDDSRYIDALSLAERVSGFWSQNLITIMGVFCSHPTDHLKNWAFALFWKNLAECTRPTDLIEPALWVRNPKKSLASC